VRGIITWGWVRKILLFVSDYVFMDQICEILYPDDLIIRFGEDEEVKNWSEEEKHDWKEGGVIEA